VNAVAPLHLTQLVLPQMKQRGEGLILNIISDAGINAYPGWGGYGASKAALEHMSRTLNAELEGTGVRVVAVDPGDMNTEMHRLAVGGGDLSHLPLPEAVAPKIAEFAS
jgi:short-subunit dehydrogenase